MEYDDLTPQQIDVLAAIASNPSQDIGQIAGHLSINKSTVSGYINTFREHSLVVKSLGNGAVQEHGTIRQEPDDYYWLITGNAKKILYEAYKEQRERTRRLQDAYTNAKEYRPKHVLDAQKMAESVDAEDTDNV